MCLHIKVAELNALSDGKGIIGMPSAIFNEIGSKKKKRTNLHKLLQLYVFSFFQMQSLDISNDCKGNVSVYKSCRIEHSLLEKEVHAYIEQSFNEMENKFKNTNLHKLANV